MKYLNGLALLFFFVALGASAQSPLQISTEGMQLEQLIEQSQAQLKEISELVAYSKKDVASLETASQSLEKLSSGIGASIEKYQGTKAYEKALLQLQTETQEENQKQHDSEVEPRSKDSERLLKFQDQSVKANLADLEAQQKLEGALNTAGQGFIPKIQTQAQLGTWQASTRVSTQLSQLLANVDGLRTELKAQSGAANGLSSLVKGAELQNERGREEMIHVAK